MSTDNPSSVNIQANASSIASVPAWFGEVALIAHTLTPFYSGSDFPLTHPYPSTDYLDNPYIIAPPPPKKSHTQLLFMVVLLVVAIMLFGASLFFYLAATHQEAVARVAPTTVVPITTPTVQPYTAQDILNEMIAHKLIVVGSDYGESLSYFFGDPLYNSTVNTPFQSSVIWSVWSGQTPGSCPDACIGLWVYSSYDIAASVEQKLYADGILAQQTPAQGPTAYPDVIEHGRCVAQSVSGAYAAIIQQFCV